MVEYWVDVEAIADPVFVCFGKNLFDCFEKAGGSVAHCRRWIERGEEGRGGVGGRCERVREGEKEGEGEEEEESNDWRY
jgi:hypothetical protein